MFRMIVSSVARVIAWSLIILATVFVFGSDSSEIVSLTSLAFTILQTIATVATLIIALLLYDRFGLNSKLVEKQTEKVLELIDSLRKVSFSITIQTKQTYFIRASRSHLKALKTIDTFKIDSQKRILVSIDSYIESIKEISLIGESYWLPQKIKQKLKFLEIMATIKVSEELDFVKLKSKLHGDKEDWVATLPELTFGEFVDDLYNLIEEVDTWIKEHTDIEINFFKEHDLKKFGI